MTALFPEPSTSEKIASVDHLRKQAKRKIRTAAIACDYEATNYWRGELDRLTRLRAAVVAGSQMDMLPTAEQGGPLL